ncbi:uncharacterized protein LOC123257740 [Drosophila ananassae]|uniref:uncharacterized protein LOC123257740 n=1 Tax=Drosophila ananassae TaxID=7217 RepID=UPI001CFFEC40|nr:uncharacterized protein LOC123257740 [Drosophila ananassae]
MLNNSRHFILNFNNSFVCGFLRLFRCYNYLDVLEFCHATLLDVWMDSGRHYSALTEFVFGQIDQCTLSDDKRSEINKKIRSFEIFVTSNLQKCSRNMRTFREKHSQWLLKSLKIHLENHSEMENLKKGRPKLTYDEGGSRLKRKLAGEVALKNENDTQLLIHAASISARKSSEHSVAFLLANCNRSEAQATEAKRKLHTAEPIPLTINEALEFFIDNSLSKQLYKEIRQISKLHNCDIYPNYKKVLEAKLQLRPVGITATETFAKVALQDLLNHTASRIVLMQEELFANLETVSSLKLIVSYGFDGSSGHSMYKQRFECNEKDTSDQSLFVTTIIPLKLIDDAGSIFWNNRTSQSVRFCRPLKMEFAKETKDHILAEKNDLDRQIEHLIPFVLTILEERKITIAFDMHMTLIDGKVLNVLTGTNSCQLCSICGAGPKQFMDTIDQNSFKPKPGHLQYGISPLHAWIRVFELLLKISYRLKFKKWQARLESDKRDMISKKEHIQKRMRQEMGLHVDKPKQNGSGNTNDGNTARKAFSNTKLFASILELDLELINSLHTILVAINCEFAIDPQKFQKFSDKTIRLYTLHYPWYPMSPTLHKILIHGSQIIAASVVPVGCLGENASEARNKLYKRDRQMHARRNSRINNLMDVFHRSMDSSDPLISSMGIKKRTARHKKQPLPQDVIELLEAPHHIVQSNTKSFVNNESLNDLLDDSDDSDDSESNEINPFSFELAVENY